MSAPTEVADGTVNQRGAWTAAI